jgi:AcrR family transcriptional regulator
MDDTVTRLLEAVERLCAEKAPSDVTMRSIADEAGVSVGLAYHYFDSKTELFARALDRIAGSLTAATGASSEAPSATLVALWASLEERPAFARLVTWFILTGQDVTSAMSGHPLIQQVAAEASRQGHSDPTTAAEILVVFGLAGAIFGPSANRAVGRDPADRALYDTMARMLTDEMSRTE